jgi:hypothetical protein
VLLGPTPQVGPPISLSPTPDIDRVRWSRALSVVALPLPSVLHRNGPSSSAAALPPSSLPLSPRHRAAMAFKTAPPPAAPRFRSATKIDAQAR